MKNFSIQRFGVLLRYDIVQNLRSYVFLMLGLFLAHFFAQLSVYYFSLKGWTQLSEGKVDSVLSDAYACAWVVTLMSMVLGLSFSFANLKSKSKRIAYLMLPASNLEKYLSRVLIFTVGIVVLNVVTFFVADVARMVALLAMPAHMGVMCGEIVKKLLELFVTFIPAVIPARNPSCALAVRAQHASKPPRSNAFVFIMLDSDF